MGKVCIVTGATRGFGRGIALVLAKEKGYTVYATGRNKNSELEALATDASQGTLGGVVHPYTLDQLDDAAVKAFVDSVVAKEGKVDVLVNSSFEGLKAVTPTLGQRFWEKPIEVFDDSYRVGTRSAFVASAHVVPAMLDNKSGLIVNVSSAGGLFYFMDVGYGVGKAGLDRLTHDMAVELKGTGVRALTLYPCAGISESAAFPGGETPAFCGRALAALVDGASEEDLDKISGKVIHSVELAQKYGTIDPETNPAPTGPFSSVEAVAGVRAALEAGPNWYKLDAELADWTQVNNVGLADCFPGYKKA